MVLAADVNRKPVLLFPEKEKNSITEQAIESINELSLQISEIIRGMPPAPGELNRKKKEGSSNQPLKAINPFSGTE